MYNEKRIDDIERDVEKLKDTVNKHDTGIVLLADKLDNYTEQLQTSNSFMQKLIFILVFAVLLFAGLNVADLVKLV